MRMEGLGEREEIKSRKSNDTRSKLLEIGGLKQGTKSRSLKRSHKARYLSDYCKI